MKHAKILSLALCSGLLFACNDDGLKVGGDGGNTNQDGGNNAQPDLKGNTNNDQGMTIVDMTASGPQDLKGVSCGQETCNGAQQCCVQSTGGQSFSATCVNMGQCGDGGLVAACDGPEDCPMSGQQCCVDVSVSFGGMSMNPSGAGGSMCGAACEANAVVDTGAGQADIKSALCHSNADCTGLVGDVDAPFVGGMNQQFSRCCTAMQGGTTLSFCAPDGVATFGSVVGIECQ